nr:phosphotransferase [Streptomyces sp. NBC_00299]
MRRRPRRGRPDGTAARPRLPGAPGAARRLLALRAGDAAAVRADDAGGLRRGTDRPARVRGAAGPPPAAAARRPRRVVHLDLHPENVMLTPDGPYVIDWANAEEGDPGLDWGMSAVILAQVALVDEQFAEPVRATLAALLADPSDLTGDGLTEALRRRAANPAMTVREVEVLGEEAELVRSFMA